MRKSILLTAAMAVLVAAPTDAAMVQLNVNILSVFTNGPAASVSSGFSLSFDDARDIGPTAAGLGISFSVPVDGTIRYAYQASNRVLTIGTNPSVGGFDNNPAARTVGLSYLVGANEVLAFGYTNATGNYYFADLSIPTLAPPAGPAGVPEPATWGLLLAGFGLTGASLRAARRRTSLAYA